MKMIFGIKVNSSFDREKDYVSGYYYGQPGKFRLYFPEFEKGTIVTDRRDLLLTEVQLQTGASMVTVFEPHEACTPKEFEQRIVGRREWMENDSGRQNPPLIMPSFELSIPEAELRAKLKIIADNEFQFLNARYAPIRQYLPNYAILKQFGIDNKVCTIISHVPRTYSHRIPASNFHILPLIGADIACLEMGKSYPPKRNMETINDVPNPMDLKRYEADLGGFLTIRQHIEKYGEDPRCKPACSACQGRTSLQILTEYHQRALLPLEFKFHESSACCHDLNNGFKRIPEYSEYLRNKEILGRAIIDLGINRRQRRLKEFGFR
jgi:hypothetical protein